MGGDPDLQFSRSFLEEEGGVNFAYNLSALQLPENSLDVILVLDVLEHVEDPEQTIMSLVSFLKSSGMLIVSGPTENFYTG